MNNDIKSFNHLDDVFHTPPDVFTLPADKSDVTHNKNIDIETISLRSRTNKLKAILTSFSFNSVSNKDTTDDHFELLLEVEGRIKSTIDFDCFQTVSKVTQIALQIDEQTPDLFLGDGLSKASRKEAMQRAADKTDRIIQYLTEQLKVSDSHVSSHRARILQTINPVEQQREGIATFLNVDKHRFLIRSGEKAIAIFTKKLGEGGFGSVSALQSIDSVKQEEQAFKRALSKNRNALLNEFVVLKNLYESEDQVKLAGIQARPHELVRLDHDEVGYLAPLYTGNYTSRSYSNQEAFTEQRASEFLQLAAGLAYLEKNVVVHGDIKSVNILINAMGAVDIADFGGAKKVDLHNIQKNEFANVLHTTHYQALNDVMEENEWDHSSEHPIDYVGFQLSRDIFSMGLVFYEALSGNQSPYPLCEYFNGNRYRDTKAEYQEIADPQGNIPSEIQELIKQMVSSDYTDRPMAHEIYETIRNCVKNNYPHLCDSLTTRFALPASFFPIA